MVRIVASGNKFYRLLPDKENTVYTEAVFFFVTNNDEYASEASVQKWAQSARKKKKEHNMGKALLM